MVPYQIMLMQIKYTRQMYVFRLSLSSIRTQNGKQFSPNSSRSKLRVSQILKSFISSNKMPKKALIGHTFRHHKDMMTLIQIQTKTSLVIQKMSPKKWKHYQTYHKQVLLKTNVNLNQHTRNSLVLIFKRSMQRLMKSLKINNKFQHNTQHLSLVYAMKTPDCSYFLRWTQLSLKTNVNIKKKCTRE